jgi:hypothetical protein
MPLSDAQRFALKQRLHRLAGNDLRIVRVGGNTQINILEAQLLDVFQGWNIERQTIGMVGLVGVNFPDNPYLTGPDASSPIVADVYTTFHDFGIELPLVPNGFMGAGGGNVPPVVIILH